MLGRDSGTVQFSLEDKMVIPLSSFDNGVIMLQKPGEAVVLSLAEGPIRLEAQHPHSVLPWSGGDRIVLEAYSVPESGTLEDGESNEPVDDAAGEPHPHVGFMKKEEGVSVGHCSKTTSTRLN